MLSNQTDLQEKYTSFIKEVVEHKLVYTLTNQEENALSSSMYFTDDEGNELPVVCFWSSEELANHCKVDDWSDFQISAIPLAEFLDTWCPDMAADQVIAGLNFDQRLFGKEVEPLALATAINQALGQ